MGEYVPEPQWIIWRRYCKKAELDLEIFKKEIIKLLEDLEDPDPCEFDHHGNCQAHWWVGDRPCPQKRLKECLKTLKKENDHDI